MRSILYAVLAGLLTGAAAWFAVDYFVCQGQCVHGSKHCQEMCLDRGYCPRERE